jgi:hypothetical protein
MEIMVVSGWSDDGADITNEVKNIQQMILVCMIWRVTLLNGLRMYIDIIDNELMILITLEEISTQKIKLDQMVK